MLKLTPKMRALLKRPLGKVFRGKKLAEFAKIQKNLIVIGDATLVFLLKKGIIPILAVFDLKIRRKTISKTKTNLIKKFFSFPKTAKNPPGTITTQAISAVKRVLSRGKRASILIVGEDDLIALPAIAYAHEGSCILYGQPKKGIVTVISNKRTRKKARKIMNGMQNYGAPEKNAGK